MHQVRHMESSIICNEVAPCGPVELNSQVYSKLDLLGDLTDSNVDFFVNLIEKDQNRYMKSSNFELGLGLMNMIKNNENVLLFLIILSETQGCLKEDFLLLLLKKLIFSLLVSLKNSREPRMQSCVGWNRRVLFEGERSCNFEGWLRNNVTTLIIVIIIIIIIIKTKHFSLYD